MKSVVKKNAFTIIELLVAMALLVMMLGLSAMVFNTAVKTQRAATATINITGSLRAVTTQLNSDFRGLREDAPLFMHFQSEIDTMAPMDIGDRHDIILFFADGDFQTIRSYPANLGESQIIHGNTARIYYGHANTDTTSLNFQQIDLLARRCHVLTGLAMDMQIPLLETGYADFRGMYSNFGVPNESWYEYNSISLTDWMNILNDPLNADYFILSVLTDLSRPIVGLRNPDPLDTSWKPYGQHNLFAQGVAEMKIQWAYTAADLSTSDTSDMPIAPSDPAYFTDVRWWPSLDPNGDGDFTDSDFDTMGTEFGVYFKLASGETLLDWVPVQDCATSGMYFLSTFNPKALKFTFKLRDSNSFFDDGKIFTHIVYLDSLP